MKAKIYGGLLAMCCILAVLNACSAISSKRESKELEITMPEKLEWKEKKCLVFKTRIAQNYASCMCTSYDGIVYCFAKDSFDEADATKFTNAAIELVAYADSLLDVKEHKGEILFNVSGAEEKLSVKNTIDFDILWKVLKQVHRVNSGEQYGLFYLYSVNQGLINKSEIQKEEIRAFFSKRENLYLLDFCIPMLETRFFDESQARMTRNAIKSFAGWYVKKHSLEAYEKLCRDIEKYDKSALVREKNEWLKSIGVDEIYKEFAKISIAPSHKQYTSHIKSQGGTVAVEKKGDYEWDCGDVCWVWNAEIVKEMGYKEAIEGVTKIEPLRQKDYAEARGFMKRYLPENVEQVNIYLDLGKASRGSFGGEYQSPNTIIVYDDWENAYNALLHEYGHFLTVGEDRILKEDYEVFSEWLAEWLAVYELENREKQIVHFFEEAAYREDLKGKVVSNIKARSISELNYLRFVGKRNLKKSDANELNYNERATLCKYIYETYGMEKLEELVNTNGEFKKVLGKTLEQIYSETKAFAKAELKKMEVSQ